MGNQSGICLTGANQDFKSDKKNERLYHATRKHNVVTQPILQTQGKPNQLYARY